MCTIVDKIVITKKEKTIYAIKKLNSLGQISSLIYYFNWELNKFYRNSNKKCIKLEDSSFVYDGFFHVLADKDLAIQSIKQDFWNFNYKLIVLKGIIPQGIKIGIGTNFMTSNFLNNKPSIVTPIVKFTEIIYTHDKL
jgi:hypothetical protein